MKIAFAFVLLLFLAIEGSSWGAPAQGGAMRGVRIAPAPVMAPIATTSENGIYSADISSDAPNEILLGVYRQEGDARILAWSKRLGWRGANAAAPAVFRVSRFISNNGNTVILRSQHHLGEGWVWVSKNGEPKRYYPHDLQRALGKQIVDYKFSSGSLDRFEGILEFIYEPKGVFATWFPALDAWSIIDLKTGELGGPHTGLENFLALIPQDSVSGPVPKEDWLKPPSEDLVKLLDAEAKRRSFEAVRKHQPNFLKNVLRPIREKIAAFIPALAPAPVPSLFSLPATHAGYMFLARRKEAEAERYIRKLLEFPFRLNTVTTFGSPPTYTIRSDERMLGDLLWRLWNDVPVETEPRALRNVNYFYPNLARDSGHYLGGVSGQVRLPMVRPDKAPGNIWIYLVPDAMPAGGWKEGEGVLTLVCPLDLGGGAVRNFAPPQFDRVNYSFTTVTPGDYRLKVVWDRRGPLAPPDGKGIPEPGDYESAESKAFTIEAGSMIRGPALECASQIAGADAYYRADEAWKRINPEPRRSALHFWNRGLLSYDEFPPPQKTWILRTNTVAKMVNNIATKAIKFKRAEVIQVLPKGDPLERDELFLSFEITGDKAAKAKVVPAVRDSHGCLFQATATLTPLRDGPSELNIRVPVFPRNEEFTLELRYIPDNAVLCSYTMQNRGTAQKARWHPRPLPITRQVGDEKIRLTQLTRSTGARFESVSDNVATLWTPDSFIYQDSEGNRSLEPSDFCRQEKIIHVEVVHESLVRGFTAPIAD